MELANFEFYGTPAGSVVIEEKDRPLRTYEQNETDFTHAVLEKINTFYPEAGKALCEIYASAQINKPYFDYRRVHRFIRCNLSVHDNRPDIGPDGIFRFEFISCPLRGECKYCDILCNPKFNSKLSDREMQVMKLYATSSKTEKIADILFISIETVKKHKHNSLLKLDLHSLSDFITYASKNQIFESHE
ncbi:MAG: helix-turn-helix domain-containing protein [Bacteroidetes bacterium]|nr:helix-turn-helix domain-containing protein [Bacteroidota bacterium]